MIIATNGTRRRVFEDQLWKELPPHKYGWKLAAEEPDEVKALKKIATTKKEKPNVTAPLAAAAPVVATAPAATVLTADEIKARIAEYDQQLTTEGMHHMVKKSLEKKKAELVDQLKAVADADSN